MEKRRWKIGWRYIGRKNPMNKQDVEGQSIVLDLTTKECFIKINDWNKRAVLTGQGEFYYAELAN